jgi:5-methylcytosine-specific restriction endonuclease McrBC regulatory subunit McrC
MYGTSGFVDKFVFNRSHDAHVQLSDENYADFLTSILVEESSRIAKAHIYSAYLPKRSHLQNLKGSVNWLSFVQRPFPMGIECDHFELTSDVLENQIVLAALVRARSFRLTSSAVRRQLAEQHFLWSGICRERVVEDTSFLDVAGRQNRLNLKYKSLHAICKLVLQGSFGFDRAGSATKLQSIWIDVPNAFEDFLEQLLTRAFERFGVAVIPQEVNVHSLIDIDGNTYSTTRPDLLIKRGRNILAVVDAKAKPQYVASSNTGKPESLVSNGDIFQIFFYLREVQRMPTGKDAKAYIVVPDEGIGIISERYKRISAGSSESGESAMLTLCSINCEQVLRQIASGKKEWDIVQDALPEIAQLIEST